MINVVQISIIIPASFELNKAISLSAQISRLSTQTNIKEIIVVTSENVSIKNKNITSKKLSIISSAPQRATAMNAGAKKASGKILYFLHADSHPPQDFDKLIIDSYKNGSTSGCFRLRFDDKKLMLRFFTYFTLLPWYWVHYGDQSLYIDVKQFNQVGGFNENLTTLEDIDIVKRIKRMSNFRIIKTNIVTSARKYRKYGYYKVQMVFIVAVSMHLLGFKQKYILKTLSIIKK